jgi:hypothetical protein
MLRYTNLCAMRRYSYDYLPTKFQTLSSNYYLVIANKPKTKEYFISVAISIEYCTFLRITITLTKAVFFIAGRKIRNASVAPALHIHASAMLLILTLRK